MLTSERRMLIEYEIVSDSPCVWFSAVTTSERVLESYSKPTQHGIIEAAFSVIVNSTAFTSFLMLPTSVSLC